MLLLASPGVQVVRAETPADAPRAAATSTADGPMCSVPDPQVTAARRAAVANQVAARLRAELGGEDAQPLNGRGYGYGSGPNVALELQRIEAEAAIARERP
jgi:hypothetical protein